MLQTVIGLMRVKTYYPHMPIGMLGICRLLFVTLLSPHADAGDMSFTICDFVTFFVHKIFVRDISGVG